MDNTKKGMDIAPPCGCYIYIVIWCEHYGKRLWLYGASKQNVGVDGWMDTP